jgi:Protein of unknown function (DUF4254)
MLSAQLIADLQDRYTSEWHDQTPELFLPNDKFLATVHAQHFANFGLWHVEDQARLPQATDAEIAEVKRTIDRINQRRNDLAEECDTLLLDYLAARKLPSSAAELHSETPGMIIDRLSILSLKLFHTREEIDRSDAPPGHAERNRERHRILSEQRSDLVSCLDHLWTQVLRGERRVKQYRQLKMYNDPTLNPAIYRGTGNR